jgi:hypothetical protein
MLTPKDLQLYILWFKARIYKLSNTYYRKRPILTLWINVTGTYVIKLKRLDFSKYRLNASDLE